MASISRSVKVIGSKDSSKKEKFTVDLPPIPRPADTELTTCYVLTVGGSDVDRVLFQCNSSWGPQVLHGFDQLKADTVVGLPSCGYNKKPGRVVFWAIASDALTVSTMEVPMTHGNHVIQNLTIDNDMSQKLGVQTFAVTYPASPVITLPDTDIPCGCCVQLCVQVDGLRHVTLLTTMHSQPEKRVLVAGNAQQVGICTLPFHTLPRLRSYKTVSLKLKGVITGAVKLSFTTLNIYAEPQRNGGAGWRFV